VTKTDTTDAGSVPENAAGQEAVAQTQKPPPELVFARTREGLASAMERMQGAQLTTPGPDEKEDPLDNPKNGLVLTRYPERYATPVLDPMEAMDREIDMARQRLFASVNDFAELDGRSFFLVALPPRFAAYVVARARAHGEMPERTLETIVRGYWQHDDWRTQQTATAPTQIGEPAGTSRRK
jgi:hypothetical protein